MRTKNTFGKSLAGLALVGAALTAGTAVAAAAPGPGDYKSGTVGQGCGYTDGTLGLDNGQGFVIVCRDGVWSFLKSA